MQKENWKIRVDAKEMEKRETEVKFQELFWLKQQQSDKH